MRTLLGALVGLTLGCTAKGYCDSVALGQPVPASANPAGPSSWCATHPTRHYAGPQDFGDAGGELFSYGPYDEADSEQCCLFTRDAGVVARWLGYD